MKIPTQASLCCNVPQADHTACTDGTKGSASHHLAILLQVVLLPAGVLLTIVWLVSTGVAMFESNEIIAYLEKTYAK